LTAFAFISSLLAGYYLSLGTTSSFFTGGIFILFFGIFDCCDGMVARMKKNSSKYGELIDMFADSLASLSFFTGLMIGTSSLFSQSYVPFLLIPSLFALLKDAAVYNYYKKQFFFHRDEDPNGRVNQIKQFKIEHTQLKKTKPYSFDRVLLGLFLAFTKMQKNEESTLSYDPKRYIEKNKPLLPIWAVCAGSTHLSMIAISVMLTNIDYYFIFAIGFSSIWMLGAIAAQKRANSSLVKEHS
jgi:phosphatidylglycerophosphate synthase